MLSYLSWYATVIERSGLNSLILIVELIYVYIMIPGSAKALKQSTGQVRKQGKNFYTLDKQHVSAG